MLYKCKTGIDQLSPMIRILISVLFHMYPSQ